MLKKTILFLCCLSVSVGYAADTNKKPTTTINYCKDPIKAKEWEGMRLKYPDDLGILHLYALRIGLCQSVDDKKISLERVRLNKRHQSFTRF